MSKLGITDRTTVMYSGDIEYRDDAFKASTNVLQTKEELIELCTKIIFASTVKHAAINFLQWEYACFAPVSPYSMRGKIPTEDERGKITTKFIMDSLPERKVCIRSAGIAFTLTEFSDDEVYLLLPGSKKGNRRKSVEHTKLVTNTKNHLNGVIIKGAYSEQNLSKACKPKNDVESLAVLSLTSDLFPPRWLFNENAVKMAFLAFQNRLHRIEENIQDRNLQLDIPYEVLLPSRIPSGIAI